MFERFTERARQVVMLSQDEARSMRHNYIGSEHVLLGLLREGEGVAARVLASLEITTEQIRAGTVRVVGEGEERVTGNVPFTPRAKKVFELALREALSLGHNYIGTEHILLGLVRDNEGVAGRILRDLEVDPENVRTEVIRMLSSPAWRRPGPTPEDVSAAMESVLADAAVAALDDLQSWARVSKENALERYFGDDEQFVWAAVYRDVERRVTNAIAGLPGAAQEEAA